MNYPSSIGMQIIFQDGKYKIVSLAFYVECCGVYNSFSEAFDSLKGLVTV